MNKPPTIITAHHVESVYGIASTGNNVSNAQIVKMGPIKINAKIMITATKSFILFPYRSLITNPTEYINSIVALITIRLHSRHMIATTNQINAPKFSSAGPSGYTFNDVKIAPTIHIIVAIHFR